MKNLTFLLCLLLPLQAFSQGIDNNNSLDSTFSETTQLTDQQADEAQTFVHQGLRDKALKEGCKDKLLKDCDPNYPNQMGVLLGGIENQIGMFYAMIFGLGGSMFGGGGSSGTTATPPAAPVEGAKTPQKDYCIYIPIAYEAISFAMQMGGQKRAEQDTANLDPQLAALAQLKEAHRTRKKTATMQSAVYGTTTACYGALLMMGPVQGGNMVYVKMGAAAALTALFMMKAKKHGQAANKVQEVIDSLPKAGTCNPWTGTACFCSEKTSAKLYPGQFQEVCVLNKGNFAGGKDNFGCAAQVNGKVTLDANCGCKKTNTCLSSKISFGRSSLGLGANFVNDANKGLQLLDPSQFDEAKLNAFSSNMATKANSIKPKGNIAVPKLNPRQKALADEMSNVAPASVAAMAATMNPASPPVGGLMSGSTASALDRLPPSLKKDMKDFEVSGGYRNSGASSPTSAAAEPGFSIPGMGAPQEPQGGVQIEEFAARAVSQADVRNTPDVAIFDIISNRYRSSAWKRLDTEGK